MSRRLYVGNLPYSTSETELEELFGRAGAVDSVSVMRDMATGRARGFAFVEMATEEEAQHAIQELDQQDLGGRSLTVNEARPKSPESTGPAVVRTHRVDSTPVTIRTSGEWPTSQGGIASVPRPEARWSSSWMAVGGWRRVSPRPVSGKASRRSSRTPARPAAGVAETDR